MNSHEVIDEWADRAGEYSPEYYAYYGPDESSELIRGLLDRFVDRAAAVLEVGCSSGRHLAHLHDHGYDDLSGIDVNDESFDVMSEAYPDLAADGTFYVDAIENVVTEFEDDQFDVVYSVETLQHTHPDNEWVFAELARIADTVITIENEGDGGDEGDGRGVNYVTDDLPLYYRDWNRVFTGLGMVEVASESLDRDTLRAFQSPSSRSDRR